MGRHLGNVGYIEMPLAAEPCLTEQMKPPTAECILIARSHRSAQMKDEGLAAQVIDLRKMVCFAADGVCRFGDCMEALMLRIAAFFLIVVFSTFTSFASEVSKISGASATLEETVAFIADKVKLKCNSCDFRLQGDGSCHVGSVNVSDRSIDYFSFAEMLPQVYVHEFIGKTLMLKCTVANCVLKKNYSTHDRHFSSYVEMYPSGRGRLG
ncbi:MAG: hypothetical protein P4N59_30410 [Negativicutes bacterium]|nr:hypothetical protein [Negativicutes bacterium]